MVLEQGTFTSVSYTHLDVYKRQVYEGQLKNSRSYIFSLAVKLKSLVVYHKIRISCKHLLITKSICQLIRCLPVSYTHLDVYKRQVMEFVIFILLLSANYY